MKVITKLALIVFLFCTSNVNATHVVGGEVGWNCLANGQYQFTMVVYRDCSPTSAQFNYGNQNVYINGNPLPKDANGNTISLFILKPDSSKWFASNNGYLYPECNFNSSSSSSCTYQAFYYISDPITLIGVPPSSGWEFRHVLACCRSNQFENKINTTGNPLLLAYMYPTANNDSVNVCYDSSPNFVDFPVNVLCRESTHRYNTIVNDLELDSISYSWGNPYNASSGTSTLIGLNYSSGYSHTSPTPDSSLNINNIASSINAITGEVKLAVYNGSGTKKYMNSIKVSSWRDGVKISEINREYPIIIVDCDTMLSGKTNKVPVVQLSSAQNAFGTFTDTVIAGSISTQTLYFVDYDTTGVGSNQQDIKIIPFGSFTLDFGPNGTCISSSTTNCAYLSQAAFFNTATTPSRYEYWKTRQFIPTFTWLTDTADLGVNNIPKTHYFKFKSFDNFCPINQVTYRTLAVTVVPQGFVTSVDKTKSLKSSVSIYPNPSSRIVSLNGLNVNDVYQIEILDIQGKLIESRTESNQVKVELDLKGNPGIYFVSLANEKGDKANFKVVKQ